MCYKNNYAEEVGIHLSLLQGSILRRKVSYIFFFFHILKLLGVSYCNDKSRHQDIKRRALAGTDHKSNWDF